MKAIELLPSVSAEEATFAQGLMNGMTDDQARSFAASYQAQRKDPMMILLLAALGLILIAGVHRFALGQAGMGVIFLLTGGFLWIGTIIDMARFKQLATVYNQRVAQHCAVLAKAV